MLSDLEVCDLDADTQPLVPPPPVQVPTSPLKDLLRGRSGSPASVGRGSARLRHPELSRQKSSKSPGPLSALGDRLSPALSSLGERLRASPLVQAASNAAGGMWNALRGGRAGRSPLLPRRRRSAAELWHVARRGKQQIVLTRRWYAMVNRKWKRIWLSCKGSHTLMAGVFFRGSLGYTRAQTVQVLVNSLAIELIVLCMMYSAPSDVLVINPVKVVASGCVAALICIPGMLISAWLFTPVVFLRLARSLLRLLLCGLCDAARLCSAARRQASYRAVRRRAGAAGRCRPADVTEASGPPPRAAHCSKVAPIVVAPVLASPAGGGGVGSTAAGGGGSVAVIHEVPWGETGAESSGEKEVRGGKEAAPSDEERNGHGESADGAAARSAEERRFSYASLNEHLLVLSLRRSLARRDWRSAAAIATGWVLNWLLLGGLLFLFSVYGCEFYTSFSSETNGEELLLSWVWSVGQRFLINEPFLIFFSKATPMLFASAFCANVCSETCVGLLTLCTESVVAFFKALKGG